jgi:hypothetical protein
VTHDTGNTPLVDDIGAVVAGYSRARAPVHHDSRRQVVRKQTALLALTVVVAVGACKKTGEGEYEVQKPVVGTTTDTVHTPTVDVGTTKDTVTVPKVTTEKKEVTVPKVDVNKPK